MRTGCGCLAAFAALLVLTTVLALGGGSAPAAQPPQAGAPGQLNPASVPGWALPLLQRAAGTCPEVTGPVLAAQIQQESGWNPHASSPAGARGLTQFMPATWAARGTDGDGDGRADPDNPADAVQSQAAYMCGLVGQVRHAQLPGDVLDLAFAAYNAGFGAVQSSRGLPPYPETQNYVRTIRGLIGRYAAAGQQTASPNGGAAAVVGAAQQVQGTPYAWGGGTLTGPSAGVGPDHGVTGFDCSSLVRYAYYRGTGGTVTLPRTTTAQYAATRAHPADVRALQPGDLLFYGNSDTALHHVALYLGNGKMLEAPQSGQTVHTTAVRLGGDFHAATRPTG